MKAAFDPVPGRTKVEFDPIPDSPCRECVPPERSPECHAKCQKYLEWEANKNRANRKVWSYKDAVNYTSISMMRLLKQKQRHPRK